MMAKMINVDGLIKYCDIERAAYKANNCGNACTALRRVVEFAKEYAVETEPVTWYTATENQPDSVGDDVLIVDHDNKYHVAYYCSKGNWIDTNTGNPIEVIKWRYLDGDSDD
jgi:hypothetical protein